MQVNYAYKFYIKPNKQQRQLLEHHFGCNRFVWNYFLHQRQTFYQTNKEDIEAKRISEIKKNRRIQMVKRSK